MLSPYRVLELSSVRTVVCGQVLADLGADVIAVEPPSGSSARLQGPFFEDQAEPERSLFWWAHNRNKRSVTLDLEAPEGRNELLRLVKDADFLVEGFAPGYLDGLGLSYQILSDVNPRIIVTSITPFGQDGPKAGYGDSDLTLMAASSVISNWGYPDRPPVRFSIPQLAYLHAGSEAVVGCLIAHIEREKSGRGQRIDVSAQAALTIATGSLSLAGAWGAPGTKRRGRAIIQGPLPLPFIYPCKDGFVDINFTFGATNGRRTRALMEVVYAEGFCDEATLNKDWRSYGELLVSGREPLSELTRVTDCVERFTRAHTKDELHEIGSRKGLLLAPVNNIKDIIQSPQLKTRDFWVTIEHPDLNRSFLYPGAFAKFSEKPVQLRSRAPKLGEHNQELLSQRDAKSERTLGPSRGRSPGIHVQGAPLEGLRVVDLSRVMVGPNSVRYLADYGATVLHVESRTHPDMGRGAAPLKGGKPGHDTSGFFHNNNAGKYGFMLNLSIPQGRGVLLRLVEWADVLIEGYSPRVMRSWDLDHDRLRQVNPALVMVSTCLNGQTGPWAMQAGFGDYGAAMCGFTELLGWPDQAPAYPMGPTDYAPPKYIAASILAALEYRRRTGMGQYIDVSQVESSLQFLSTAALDYAANGRVASRQGNRDARAVPHGVFPCKGDDRWVAIAVETESQWEAFCRCTGHEDWISDLRFRTFAQRKGNEEALEAGVRQWTAQHSREEIEALLQGAGVPASAVLDVVEAAKEPQMNAWGHFVEVEHATLGKVVVESCRFKLARTPASVRRAGPTMGQHNSYVLGELLGLRPDEIEALEKEGVCY